MAEIDYTDTDGLQVLWHLLTTEPFFWVILSIGFIAILLSWWSERLQDKDDKHVVQYYDDSHHINR
jgi:hypothetical protein|tara:strand:+ start:7414 stop:7611 length:198 start_codon:yes stop_codon:yes gene_type:complete